jgi:hypothetical protein
MDNNNLGNTTTNEYKPETDAESVLESQGDDTEDPVTEDQPPKKKQKKTVVRDKIKKMIVTGSQNEASSYALWTGVSSGTGQ